MGGVDTLHRRYCGVRTNYTRDLLEKAKRWYLEYGLQYTLWKILKMVWVKRRHGIRFSDLHRLHCLIAGRDVRKNATWKALNTLAKKGLVKSINGIYVPVILDETVVMGSIDFKRVRTRQSLGNAASRKSCTSRIPRPVARVLNKARELVRKGDVWKAVDLIAHTLLPLRQTGTLIAKVDNMFIYYERKTGFMHYFISDQLSRLWRELGLPEGYLGIHRGYEADQLIKRMYGSHDIARRIHYQLKELGWFTYGDPLLYELWGDMMGNCMLAIYRFLERGHVEKVFEAGKVGNGAVKVKAGVVLPMEHVKEENEETYFNRSKGML